MELSCFFVFLCIFFIVSEMISTGMMKLLSTDQKVVMVLEQNLKVQAHKSTAIFIMILKILKMRYWSLSLHLWLCLSFLHLLMLSTKWFIFFDSLYKCISSYMCIWFFVKRILNTIGNVPLEWYDDFDHIGYDLEGNKITKPKSSTDKIDEFVYKNEDPTAWYLLRLSLTRFSCFVCFCLCC